ncbi:MAG: U4/U6-U5 snRNP complex subunit prp31 [Chaenotheca gracillima]|nr:MAG: U4/U6-U5 snRNP complex subunit prp31 [Chaenotheca gracillima]
MIMVAGGGGGAAAGLLTSFVGALQASISVLLTISYGLIATQFSIISEASAKDISKLCVRIFLPALLITNVGSELHASTVGRYIPILSFGLLVTKLFKLPAWVTPAIAFNNTTSLPLLLVQSLDASGILSSIVPNENGTADAVHRAKSYFLVCAMVSNSLTFSLGPKLLDWEEVPDTKPDDRANNGDVHGVNGEDEAGRLENGEPDDAAQGYTQEEQDRVDEGTSLLPNPVLRQTRPFGAGISKRFHQYWATLPNASKRTLGFMYEFLNAPLIGAMIGALLGLVPALHQAFFDPTDQGGIFRAWLTSSIQNVGELFAALQLVVVGAKLCRSLRRWKQGEASGHVPYGSMMLVIVLRFVIWPMYVPMVPPVLAAANCGRRVAQTHQTDSLSLHNRISIPLIWAVASRTHLLDDDPMLWFTMMLMPTGPPAITLTALADVNGEDEEQKMAIAKFLTVSPPFHELPQVTLS